MNHIYLRLTIKSFFYFFLFISSLYLFVFNPKLCLKNLYLLSSEINSLFAMFLNLVFTFFSFNTVGYGCMTCIGNSGPLPESVAEVIEKVTIFIYIRGFKIISNF